MMPRKKRIALLISIISIISLIVVITFILLYLNTDMFKSNQTLFTKYIGKNIENLEIIEAGLKETRGETMLQNGKFTEKSEIKMNYTENIGTTSEITKNIINKLKISIDGQIDKINKYNYKDIKLLNDGNETFELEYIKNDDTYGIRFSNLFKQYVLVENNNLKELFKKIGYTDEQIANIPNVIEMDNIAGSISFTAEEKENLKNKYVSIINKNVSKENFKKESNQTITINQKNLTVNVYTLSITKEKINDIYMNILENLKQDEIILSKLDEMQNVLNVINNTNNSNIKETFVTELEKEIQEIAGSNIGNEETRIIVYENEGQTVRTSIQAVDYEINLDVLFDEEENDIEISVISNGEENEKYTLKYSHNDVELKIKKSKNEEVKNITFSQTNKLNEKNYLKSTTLKIEDSQNRIETTIAQELNQVENFEEEIVLNDENSIQLNQMSQEKVKQIIDRISSRLSEEVEKIQREISKEEIEKVFKAIGILKEQEILNGEGISETEKNRFNSIYEIFKGQELSSDNVIQVIETIKDDLNNMQVISNQELKLEISRNQKNEQIADTLKTFIEKDKNKKYNIDIEYDENGLVKYIVLTML